MKRTLLTLLLAIGAASALAQNAPLPQSVQIGQTIIGSGEQNMLVQNGSVLQNAPMVGDYGVYHVASYLPYSPTSATIWPRVVEVECRGRVCDPYDWKPSDGRAEYVYFRPKQKLVVVPEPAQIVYVPGPREICKKSDG